MRTTITLTPEAEDLVTHEMKRRDTSFKSVVNQAIIDALSPRKNVPFRTRTRPLGALIPMDKALALASQLDDAEFAMKRA